jgi:hypothetical protein
VFVCPRPTAARRSAALLAALLAALAGCSLFPPTGTVTGRVVLAASPATPMADVRVTVADTTYWTDTASDGSFSIRAPVTAPGGSTTLSFIKAGYAFADAEVIIAAKGDTVSPGERLAGYPQITSGQYRFILTWGADPADLDAHLFMPLDPGSDEVWSGNSPAGDGSAAFELGGTTGYGPEAIAVTSTNPGTYTLSVNNVSGSPDLGASGAAVRVYTNTGLLHTVDISSASGSAADPWWKVLTFDETTAVFTILNQMSLTGP